MSYLKELEKSDNIGATTVMLERACAEVDALRAKLEKSEKELNDWRTIAVGINRSELDLRAQLAASKAEGCSPVSAMSAKACVEYEHPYPSTLPDDELSALVAERVAGWKHTNDRSMVGGEIFSDRWVDECGYESRPLPYSTSADAVLPLLEKTGGSHNPWIPCPIIRFDSIAMRSEDVGWMIDLGSNAKSRANTFARAACISLLRAHAVHAKNPDAGK